MAIRHAGFAIPHTLLAIVAGILMITAAACGSDGHSQGPTAPTAGTVTAVVVTSASTSGAAFQLSAMAQMSDGTARDVTRAASWESSNPVLATISSTGMVSVVGSGELDARATYHSATGSLHLLVATLPVSTVTVSGAPSSSSSPFQLTATARLVDGSLQDVTRSATWESSNTLASISPSGYVTILGNGDVDLRATYQGVTGSAHTNASLPQTFTLSGVVVEIAPTTRPIAGARIQIIGGDHAFSNDQGVFAISGVAAGRTLIEVSKDGYEIFEANVIIDPDIELRLNLYPTPPNNPDGVRATARCNDGSWSWAQTPTAVCTANGGVAYPVCPGPFCTP